VPAKKSCSAISRRDSAGRARRSPNITPSSRSCRIAPSCCPRWPTSASSDAGEIQKSLCPGAPYLARLERHDLALLPGEQCGVDQIDAASNRLVLAVPTIKKNLIEACVHTVGTDGVITDRRSRTAPRCCRHARLPHPAVRSDGSKGNLYCNRSRRRQSALDQRRNMRRLTSAATGEM